MAQVRFVILGRGQFPTSSAGLRIRMWAKGLEANGIRTDIIISYPAPLKSDLEEKNANEYFSLKAQNGSISSLKNIYNKIKGTYNSYKTLKQNYKNIDGVLLYGLGFLEGYFLYRFCKKYGIKFFAERCDENRQIYANRSISFTEKLALYNDLFFDKYLINKLNAFFVVTSYLENKYKSSKYSDINLKRSVPVYIDIESYNKLSEGNPEDIKEVDISVFNSNDIKIFFAGSCNHTNGLFFFLKCAANLYKNNNIKFKIILIFHSGNVNSINKFCEILGIKNIVTILPKLPFRFIPILYKNADILVLPEMGDVVANAGFPGKVGEYLASGKAIISTEFSDLSRYLINMENAMISPLGNERIYTDNLKLLIENAELRFRIGKKAIETAKEYFDYKKGVMPLIKELIKS